MTVQELIDRLECLIKTNPKLVDYRIDMVSIDSDTEELKDVLSGEFEEKVFFYNF